MRGWHSLYAARGKLLSNRNATRDDWHFYGEYAFTLKVSQVHTHTHTLSFIYNLDTKGIYSGRGCFHKRAFQGSDLKHVYVLA